MDRIEKREEFYACISSLISQPDVQSMDTLSKHAPGVSCLDHCILVSYVSYLFCRSWNLNYLAAARGGLLHDLYLCDWPTSNIGVWKRLHIHPEMALENASVYGLSELEQDIILKHMWPFALRRIPRHKESVIVNFADKICTIAEIFGIYKLVHAGDILLTFNDRRRMEEQYAH